MIRLESGGSDRTLEAGFRENSVYSTYILAALAGSFKCVHIGIVFFYRTDSPWIAASGQHDIHSKPSNAPVTIHIRMDIHKHEMS
jgi:hypothetical protein